MVFCVFSAVLSVRAYSKSSRNSVTFAVSYEVSCPDGLINLLNLPFEFAFSHAGEADGLLTFMSKR